MTKLTKELKQQYQTYNQEQLNEDFIDACETGHLELVKYLLTSPKLKIHADIHTDNGRGFRWACAYRHLDVVKYLLTSPDLQDHADIHADNDGGFRWACRKGYLEIIQYLLTSPDLKEHVDIHSGNDAGFQWVCNNQYLEIVEYFLSFTGEQCIDFQETNYNLDWAIENQYDDVILAMMKNLKNNNPLEYLECLPKIKAYDKKLNEKVKNLKLNGDEVNPQETSLFL